MEEKFLNKHKYNKNIIKQPKYTSYLFKDTNMEDLVAVYFDGKNFKTIPINYLINNPIIYDKYYDKNTVSDITITLCPYTLTGLIYFGKYKLTTYVYNSNITLKYNNEDDDLIDDKKRIIQLSGNIYLKDSLEILNEIIRREEIKIMTLKKSLIMFPDSLYLKNTNQQIQIVPKTYYNNNKILFNINKSPKFNQYEPKLLITGIEYISDNKKYTVIISKKKNIETYLEENYEKIKEKYGIIVNCFWFAWISMYPNSKVIII